MKERKMEVMNAHYKRRCHPETCCCSSDYVIVENGMVVEDVDSVEEGEELIKYCLENNL